MMNEGRQIVNEMMSRSVADDQLYREMGWFMMLIRPFSPFRRLLKSTNHWKHSTQLKNAFKNFFASLIRYVHELDFDIQAFILILIERFGVFISEYRVLVYS